MMEDFVDRVYQLKVGGKRFTVDSEDVEKLGSNFLSTLVDPESSFARPEDGIFVIEADAACFSAFLHLSRFGLLRKLSVAGKIVLEQTGFWGIREEVAGQLHMIRKKQLELTKVIQLHERAKGHHNFNRHGSSERICCTDCGLGNTMKYVCIKCNRVIVYKKDLGWCHKCELCIDCQDGRECRNDSHSYLLQIDKLKKELGLL